MAKSKLPCHEWCVVSLFCLILLLLSAFALRGEKPVTPLRAPEPVLNLLEVKIEGEVANPGLHQMPLKSTLKELLEIAEPLPTADLSELRLRRRLKDGQTVRIPKRRSITIQITGLVPQPGPLEILSGTRIQELVSQLEVLPEADLKALSKRKSFLYEGDVLEVPAKKPKEKSSRKKNKKKEKRKA